MTDPNAVSAAVWDWRTRAAGAQARAAADRARALRQAAIQGVIGFAAALALGMWWRPAAGYLIGGVTATLLLLAVLAPAAHARVEQALKTFGRWVGLALTWLLMPILFYLVFLPTGLLLRARGRLRITRRPDRALPTYWTEPARTPTRESYRRQF
jgi:hypothetical protein